jgi:hypothetical protein
MSSRLANECNYSWLGAYRTSKLGTVLFTTEPARRSKEPAGSDTGAGSSGDTPLAIHSDSAYD